MPKDLKYPRRPWNKETIVKLLRILSESETGHVSIKEIMKKTELSKELVISLILYCRKIKLIQPFQEKKKDENICSYKLTDTGQEILDKYEEKERERTVSDANKVFGMDIKGSWTIC